MSRVIRANFAHARAYPPADPRGWQEQTALHETTLALLDRLDLASLLEAIVERAGALLGTPHGYLYLLEPGDEALRIRVATGNLKGKASQRLARGEGFAGRVWESGEPLVVDEYHAWSERLPSDLRLGAVVGVPLLRGDEVAGVLGLAHFDPERRFGDHDVALLARFGQLASIGLENASLYAAAQAEVRERRQAEEELLDTVSRLRRSEFQLQLTHEEMVRRLAYAAEFRSAEMGEHVERMSRYCVLLGRRLGLDDERCELLRIASPLHDVGKIGIPDSILLKPGPLTADERRVMEEHTEIGHALLAGSRSELLELAATIALTHHERFDGTGYPRRLAGEAIPLEGRIASVADVFDALTSDRIYRSAFLVEQALELMAQGRGTQFDPLVLDLFFDALGEVETIRSGFEPEDDELAVEEATVVRLEPRRPPPPSEESIDLSLLAEACREATSVVLDGEDARQAMDRALARLSEVVGPDLLSSVYVLDHDRLWLVVQSGYREVRDGFSLGQGVMGRSVRTAEPQLLIDVAGDSDFIAEMGEIRSELALPFVGPGGTKGVLNLETLRKTLPLDAAEACLELAQAFGERADAVVGELQPDVSRLARLCVYASSLRGVPAIADFVTRTVARLLELDTAELSLRREGAHHRLASFWRRPDLEREPFGAADLAALARLVPAGDEAYSAVELPPEREGGPPLRVLWLPLRVAGGEIGALVGRLAPGSTLEHERSEAATLLAQHAAALIDVAQALQREQRAAVTDPLTGLLNRRGFDERLHEELRRARRSGRPFAIAVADCDGLKDVNDRAGHEAGDAVLQIAARSLRAGKRVEDVAARLGGDEFALILPETDGASGLGVVERLRLELETKMSRQMHRLTATFGVAAYPEDGSTVRDLLRAADQALYRAKALGKNRSFASGT